MQLPVSDKWLEEQRLWLRTQANRPASTPDKPRWCPHDPTPRQAEFLELACLEAMYGGAARGGKTDALLMAALEYVDVPGYAALILRRTYADLSLPGAIMDRAHDWLAGTAAIWNDREKTWTFPSGATLTFGYCETENDKFRYQGSEIQFCAFDELTQFSEGQYRYLFSRICRREGVDIPLRMRSGTNPGGVGHDWVRGRFVDPETKQTDAVFVPALLTDNPHIDQIAYREALSKLDPVTRAQLEQGSWDAVAPGDYFNRDWFTVVEKMPAAFRRKVRYWDMASSDEKKVARGKDPDYTASCLLAEDLSGEVFWILDVTNDRIGASGLHDHVKRTADQDGPGTRIYMEQEGGSSGEIAILSFQNALMGYAFEGVRSTGNKTERAKPASAAAKNRKFFMRRAPWNKAFVDQLHAFPHGSHDDMVDTLSGAFNKLDGAPAVIPIAKVRDTVHAATGAVKRGGWR